MRKLLAQLKTQYQTEKSMFFVYFILRLIVLGILIRAITRLDYQAIFYCVLSLILFMLPTTLEHRLKITLPNTLEVIILFFIFANEILGELGSYFVNVPNWDTLMHTTTGFLAAAVGFALIDMLNRSERFTFRMSPFYVAFTAFCFSMTVGVIWEFFEFAVDRFLGGDMQKDTVISAISSVALDPTRSNKVVTLSGIRDVILVTDSGEIPHGLDGYLDIGIMDTMKDLFVNFIGAVVFSFIGFFYVKNRGEGRFARRFIPTVRQHEQAGAEPLSETSGEQPPETD